MRRFLMLLPFLLSGACVSAMSADDDLKPWPMAEPGETRFVVRLPELADEASHGVELEIGREMEIDCNQHWFGGKFERQVVPGWGYPLYRLTSIAGPASTMMACPEQDKRMVFVPVRLEDPYLRYNSKLPVVVYVPEGFNVRYRIWSTDGASREATVE